MSSEQSCILATDPRGEGSCVSTLPTAMTSRFTAVMRAGSKCRRLLSLRACWIWRAAPSLLFWSGEKMLQQANQGKCKCKHRFESYYDDCCMSMTDFFFHLSLNMLLTLQLVSQSARAELLPCSLVKKDAGLLDAFGKGASEDIQRAKTELYSQMTYNPATNSCLASDLQAATPPLSPRHGLP